MDKLLASPLQWLVFRIYHLILFLRGRPFHAHNSNPIRVVCLSDTHDNIVSNVPDGDLLIHAGDLTNSGTVEDIQKQLDWLASLPHRHKVFVAGNHDSYFDPKSRKAVDKKQGRAPDLKGLHYLQDDMVTLEFKGGRMLNVYGAADIPECGGTDNAFQYQRHLGPWLGRIPNETDVLVTHTPPRYHLDLDLGCDNLLMEIWRVKPKLHVFGHVHWGAGRESAYYDECQKAYEIVMARPRKGILHDLLPGSHWTNALRVVYYGLNCILWKWIMQGPGSNNAGLMVNAGQMYGNTGKLGNKAQVVNL